MTGTFFFWVLRAGRSRAMPRSGSHPVGRRQCGSRQCRAATHGLECSGRQHGLDSASQLLQAQMQLPNFSKPGTGAAIRALLKLSPLPGTCGVRHCAGTTTQRRNAPRTMSLPGTPREARLWLVLPFSREAAARPSSGVAAAPLNLSSEHAVRATLGRQVGPEGRSRTGLGRRKCDTRNACETPTTVEM